MKAETTVTRVEELLAESSSVPDLATRLGRACLDDAERLKRIRSGQKAREWLDFIEKWTRSVGMEEWVEFVEDPTRFRDCLGPDFCQVLSQAQTRHPLDCYGVLKGLCTGALFQLYDVRTDEIHELVGPIPLRRGTPMPYLQRKPKRASEGVVTPWRQTVREGSNGLEIKAFDFFKLEPEPSLEITLDYRSSAELELADNAGEGFPLIATIHPPESGNVHTELPSLLAEAGVNFLLVPSMTEKFGAFNGPVASIASQCQGVAVVANVRFRPDGEPFLMMGATPFSKPEEQTGSSCGERGGALSEVAIFNPNLPFGEAIDWIR